jgi:hypothetical protein
MSEFPSSEQLSDYETFKVKALGCFQETFQPETRQIYYPFCGSDITPWLAFPETTTIGVDNDPARLALLQERGIDSVSAADVKDTEPPQNTDLLLTLGYKFRDKTVGKQFKDCVKPEGYIITDSLENLGLFMGLFRNELDLVGRIDQTLTTEVVENNPQGQNGLEYLRYLADDQQSKSINARIAYEAGVLEPDTYRDNLFIICKLSEPKDN